MILRFFPTYYILRSLGKTLCQPAAYIAPMRVGGMSYLASGLSWGAVVPFVMPLRVQSFITTGTPRELIAATGLAPEQSGAGG